MANYKLSEDRAVLARTVAEEGIVLLKNEDAFFPIRGERVAVFGRTQVDTIKCGTGSAYCLSEYSVDILTGLENAGIRVDEKLAATYRAWSKRNSIATYGVWGSGTHVNPEMPVSSDMVLEAAMRADKAIVVIGRTAGENDDVVAITGDFLLSVPERKLIESVCRYFTKVAVVINSGNMIDMHFTTRSEIKAVVLLNLPGMEGGNALGNVLSGKVTPSGKLTDTIATSYLDYPSAPYFGKKSGIIQNYYEDIFVGYRYFETFEKAKSRVLYPFGFGLSYTSFEIGCVHFEADRTLEGKIRTVISVKNTGNEFSGKEVVMLYATSPKSALGTPAYELRAFAKTRLLAPGEVEYIPLSFDIREMASFDDLGVLGTKDAWVMAKGGYKISLGNNIRTLREIGTFENPETTVIKQCAHIPTELARRMTVTGEMEELGAIPPDPTLGVPVHALRPTVISSARYFAKDEHSVTYRLNVSSTGVYRIRFIAEKACPVTRNGKPLDEAERYFEKDGFETVLNLGKNEFVFEGVDAVGIQLEKNDAPMVVKGDGKSYVEGGKYTECELWVINREFHDKDGALKHGRALRRMHSPGRYALYKLDVQRAGVYDLRFRYANAQGEQTLYDTFSIIVSNVVQDIEPVTFAHTCEDPKEVRYATSEPTAIALPAGEAYLKIVSKMTNTTFSVAYLELNPTDRTPAVVEHKAVAADETVNAENGEAVACIPRRALPETVAEIDFRRVMNGTLSMDDFVDALTDDELAALTCANDREYVGGIFERGIPDAVWSDGPVGMRQPFKVTVYPSSTMVSTSWNTALATEYGRAVGQEANLYHIDVWLAPAMNIHRDPCCGRNFEYHSEDPCVTANIVSAMVKGVQEMNVAATIKHFLANNTEYQRLRSNSRLSARALREIYARAFEAVIRKSDPWSIMTSYNHISGVKVCESPLICKTIVRDEFGYKGVLMTDFGNDSVHHKELQAGHDLKMPFGDTKTVAAALKDGWLSRDEVKVSVKRILELVAKTVGKQLCAGEDVK